ncbi:hypothetical protein QKQ66_gp145 [Dione juno nucleopolyhedrovirus]|uniref:Ac11 n=1 Tax=Dione juno nucleopolyhedrovirus TaxID=2594175 RepID=A0AAE6H320_9ABAC|nr:hypothetical protein QKQ66_gp145 [Dione juno nucleopolyhedrovirus]QDL57077.1 hypothetical protein DijuNPV-ORF-145 [Dione juno nucleopolyhedrovirus]
MSLSSKLVLCAYYGAYNLPHERYGESFHLYRIVHEHLTDTYRGGVSCVRRDIATARCLNNNALCPDLARQLLDVDDAVARLSTWYRCGDADNLCDDVQRVLAAIDCRAPLNKRVAAGANIFALDAIAEVPSDAADDLLTTILDRFMHFVRRNALARVADVFDPEIKADGWWYHKFCVLTYIHRISVGAVPVHLTARLQTSVQKFIQPDGENGYDGNHAAAMADVYGRFCGIGREHFAHHKMACMHILFQYLRGDVTPADERHSCFGVIKNFGRHCRDTYADLRTHADALYIHATSDKQKNALFDLLCCVNGEDIDADCYNYIVNKFYTKLNKK